MPTICQHCGFRIVDGEKCPQCKGNGNSETKPETPTFEDCIYYSESPWISARGRYCKAIRRFVGEKSPCPEGCGRAKHDVS
jgi:hypothetical protein